jgi:hypothetical protein
MNSRRVWVPVFEIGESLVRFCNGIARFRQRIEDSDLDSYSNSLKNNESLRFASVFVLRFGIIVIEDCVPLAMGLSVFMAAAVTCRVNMFSSASC